MSVELLGPSESPTRKPRFLNPDFLLLPNEVLLLVANFLERETDINSLAKTNRRFYSPLNPYLYRRNSLQSGSSALLWAAQEGMAATARTCVLEGANVEAINSHGRTPLFQAAVEGHEEVLKLLLETGRVDVDSKDSDDRTPLSVAAGHGYEAVVKLLLATGRVNIDSKDRCYRTPFFWAAARGHEAVLKLLLETGRVNVDSKDPFDRTPLSVAAEQGHEAVGKLLLATGRAQRICMIARHCFWLRWKAMKL
ncbi:unnamed protein product [Penicillium egyptiacum]|uniref:F-box domain-containing protein n=1 Tax=Penicillium egyptiacum TaxID=1303716 RepID=A0A9W4KGW8_9EURO|nr:unnamed protein product [Penicillium egyptiacum]